MALTNSLLTGSTRLDGILTGGAPMRREIAEKDLEDVKKIQRGLQKLTGPMPRSFPPRLGGEPDGVFGSETNSRIIAFQQRMFPKDWREWDGRVGPKTLQAMNDELDKGVAPTPPGPTPPGPTPPPPGPTPPGPVPLPVGPIEKCKQNAKITLDGTNAVNLTPPMLPSDWVTQHQKVFDTICDVSLGRSLIEMVQKETIVKPYIPTTADPQNAYSKGRRYIVAGAFVIEFTAHIWDIGSERPGARADEVLLHEFIHLLENNFSEYSDMIDVSLKWDGADFLTVNGTNVYSSLSSRGLRKDHRGFVALPSRYSDNQLEHLIIFRENYEAAHRNNAELIRLFKGSSATWNPFRSFSPTKDIKTYFAEILPRREWKWIYDLNEDKTARWRDRNNSAQFGSGQWREEGGKVVIDWNGGSWDNFPRPTFPGNRVSGRNKTAGIEYDSEVDVGGGRPWPL